MKSILVKGITLTTFIALVCGFVAYKAGYFGQHYSSIALSPNGSVINTAKGDSIKKKDTTVAKQVLMPSSKVMIFTEREKSGMDSTKLKPHLDSVAKHKLYRDSIAKLKSYKDSMNFIIMGSSKSAPMFAPKIILDTLLPKQDSTKKD